MKDSANAHQVRLPSALSSMSEDALAGAFAGFTGRMLTAPFDVIKIRNQLLKRHIAHTPSMIETLKNIIKEEGIFALWKGNLSAVMLWVSYAFIQFAIFGRLKVFFESIINERKEKIVSPFGEQSYTSRSNNTLSLKKTLVLFLAGASAGTIATIATYPFDIMRTQFAVQETTRYFHHIPSYIQYTYKTYGMRGFFAGVGPAVVGVTPYVGLNFAMYETLKSFTSFTSSSDDLEDSAAVSNFTNWEQLVRLMKKGMLGGIAGGTSKFILFPLDTIKKRMQAQSLHTAMVNIVRNANYGTMTSCVKTILKEEGLRGLYRGIVPTLVKAATGTAITFMAYEHAKEFLQARKSSQLLLQSPASSLPALPRTTTITPLLPKNQKNNELQGQQGEQQR